MLEIVVRKVSAKRFWRLNVRNVFRARALCAIARRRSAGTAFARIHASNAASVRKHLRFGGSGRRGLAIDGNVSARA
jgi:hypothetical protein